VPLHQLGDAAKVERTLAGEELVHHEAERVDVALDRRWLTRELLRSHVSRRAGARADFSYQTGEPEVGDAQLAPAVEHQIRRLQIAVEDSAIVRGREPGTELPREIERLVGRQATDPLRERREIFAVDVLHREKRQAVHFADVVDAADVRMRDLSRAPDLLVELREPRGIAADRFREKLERDRLAEPKVVRTIHLAHAALAERSNHPITAGDDGARQEPAFIDDGTRREPAGGGAG
jgi:hypothetical protein